MLRVNAMVTMLETLLEKEKASGHRSSHDSSTARHGSYLLYGQKGANLGFDQWSFE